MESSGSKKRKNEQDELSFYVEQISTLYKNFKKLKKEAIKLEKRVSELENNVSKSTSERSDPPVEVSYYEGSSIIVNRTKLRFCLSDDFNKYVSRSLMLIFSIRELYRHNILGGSSFDKIKKVPLDYLKMIEIYSSVKQRFPYMTQLAERELKSRINHVIINKVGKLNRSFREIKQNYLAGPDGEKRCDYPFSRDELYLLDNLNNYINDPSLFIQLDNIIDGNLSIKQEREIELEQDLLG